MNLYDEPDMGVGDRVYCDRVGLYLLAARVEYDHDEYGAIVPLVTERQFRSYISVSAANDGNGIYNPDGIVEGDGALRYTDDDGNTWVWQVAGIVRNGDDCHPDEIGKAMYRITGFGGWYA